jgi:Ca2+-binding EF-hand superfamily protein
LASADYDETGSILREDLTRVFKRIGLSTIEPNLPMIMEIGGVTPNQEKIDIDSFSNKFMKALNNKINSVEFEKKMFIHKVHSLIKAKQFSIFDVFVRMDVNQSGSLTKIELKTGMQALGIVITNSEMQTLWKSIKKQEVDEEKPR